MGGYRYEEIKNNLRKLDRPTPGKYTGAMLQTSQQPAASPANTFHVEGEGYGQGEGEDSPVPLQRMQQSLLVLPEAFTDGQMQEIDNDGPGDEFVWVPGDMPDNVALEEDEAVAWRARGPA